ncbi:hypothetical protein CDAR_202781 [Caerostris darwini]|uniref:Uncharacterized protein n=1 Tax=Caerostris darwini TaxID=1538125 RepID=A0AAV4RQP7_9ARAC|nr:hypothetical protein CDAR_202781 [Caerostris darwini]
MKLRAYYCAVFGFGVDCCSDVKISCQSLLGWTKTRGILGIGVGASRGVASVVSRFTCEGVFMIILRYLGIHRFLFRFYYQVFPGVLNPSWSRGLGCFDLVLIEDLVVSASMSIS